MNNTLCSAAWTDMNIHFGDRTIRYCCKSAGIPFPDKLTVDFFTNNSRIVSTRTDLLNGIEAKDCSGCWNDYKKTGTAYRDFKNSWSSTKDVSPVIKTIEIMLDNLCDLSCIYCSEDSSSKIAAEKKLTSRLLTAQNDDLDVFIEFLVSLSKKQSYLNLSFAGGEVTYSKSFFYFIEKILNIKELTNFPVSFSLLTNGNTSDVAMIKMFSVLNKIPNTWTVSIGMSNESTFSVSEQIRDGLAWDRFLKNFKLYYKNPKVSSLLLAPTLTIFTVKGFPEFIKSMSNTVIALGNNKPITVFGNWVTEPDILNPVYCDSKYKESIRELKSYVISSNVFNSPMFLRFLDSLESKIGIKELDMDQLNTFLDDLAQQKRNTGVYELKKLL